MELRSDVTVDLVRFSASDEDVVAAARVSTLGERARNDEAAATGGIEAAAARGAGLVEFLMRDRHGTPFEHNSMTFFISAPVFVFREFQRHRVGFSYNEESGRYRELRPVFYVPAEDRRLRQVGRPGAYQFEHGTDEQRRLTVDTLTRAYKDAYEAYQLLLRDGVAREIARVALPLGIYSSMYVTCNARSLMHFLGLRTQDRRAATPSHPQREIEMVAQQMEVLWAEIMPVSYDAFNRHGRVSP